MADTGSELLEYLAKRSCKSRVVSISRLSEMDSTLHELENSGEIKPDFFPEVAKYFNFDDKQALPEIRSIIIVASPQLPASVLFDRTVVTIPPTYIYREIWNEQMRLVKSFLEPRGYKVARARLPFKTLAVRSGLGRYGRNNVGYIQGMGSFFRLAAGKF